MALSTSSVSIKQEATTKPYTNNTTNTKPIKKPLGFSIDNLISSETREIPTHKLSTSPPLPSDHYNSISPTSSSSSSTNKNHHLQRKLRTPSSSEAFNNTSLLNVSPSLANQTSPLSSSGSSSSLSQSSSSILSKNLNTNYTSPQSSYTMPGMASPTGNSGYPMLSNMQNQLMWQQSQQMHLQGHHHQMGCPPPSMHGQQVSPNSSMNHLIHQQQKLQQQQQHMSGATDPQLSALHFHLQREQAFNMFRSGGGFFNPAFSMSQCKNFINIAKIANFIF